MHYRNGKVAKNGDKIVQLGNNGEITAIGVLYIAPTQHPQTTACMVDCLLLSDVADLLKEKGLDKRPDSK